MSKAKTKHIIVHVEKDTEQTLSHFAQCQHTGYFAWGNTAKQTRDLVQMRVDSNDGVCVMELITWPLMTRMI